MQPALFLGLPDPFIDGLNCPPFGLGVARHAEQLATGVTSAGFPYQTLKYSSSLSEPPAYGGIGTMRLAAAWPACFLSLPDNPRPGIQGFSIDNNAGLLVVAENVEFGRAVLDAALPAIREYARRRPLDLAIDGNSLTAQPVPGRGDGLGAAMEDLAMVAGSLNADPALRAHEVPEPHGLGWYGYPGWGYVPRDDRVLVGAPQIESSSASNHRGLDIIYSPPWSAPPTVGFRHSYESVQYVPGYGGATNLVSGSGLGMGPGGHYTTTTHSQSWVRCQLEFALPTVGVGWEGGGTRLFFAHAGLDTAHPIFSDDSPLATAMIRPVADFIANSTPPPFLIQGPLVWFQVADLSPGSVDWCQDFTDALIKQFTPPLWHMLGYQSSPYGGSLR